MDAQKLEDMVKAAFGGLKARGSAPPPRKVTVPLHKDTLVSVVTDSEITQSSVSLIGKRRARLVRQGRRLSAAAWCSGSSSRC